MKTFLRRPALCALLCCCGLTGLASCEPDVTSSLFEDQQVDAGGRSGQDSASGQDVSVSTGMTGRWLLATDWSTCVTIGGPPVELRTRKLLLVDMTHKGHKIEEIRRVCSVVTTPLIGLTTLVPKAVADGIGKLPIRSTVFTQGAGASYSSEAEVQLWGAKLDDPLADPMPTKEGDVGLADTDEDGKPGATLRIDGICEIYVSQRAIATVAGTIDQSGDKIAGKGLHSTEQHVLGATKPICAQKYTTDPNDPHNTFVMIRAATMSALDTSKDGVIDCEELIAGQSKVTSWLEPDNDRCKAK